MLFSVSDFLIEDISEADVDIDAIISPLKELLVAWCYSMNGVYSRRLHSLEDGSSFETLLKGELIRTFHTVIDRESSEVVEGNWNSYILIFCPLVFKGPISSYTDHSRSVLTLEY